MTTLETAEASVRKAKKRIAKTKNSLKAIDILVKNLKAPLTSELNKFEAELAECKRIKTLELEKYRDLILNKFWDLIDEHLTADVCKARKFPNVYGTTDEYDTLCIHYSEDERSVEVRYDWRNRNRNPVFSVGIWESKIEDFTPVEAISCIKKFRYDKTLPCYMYSTFSDDYDKTLAIAKLLNL